jgi:hypothetical protein
VAGLCIAAEVLPPPHQNAAQHSLAMAVVLNSSCAQLEEVPTVLNSKKSTCKGARSHAASVGHGIADDPEERRPHDVLLVLLIRNA